MHYNTPVTTDTLELLMMSYLSQKFLKESKQPFLKFDQVLNYSNLPDRYTDPIMN